MKVNLENIRGCFPQLERFLARLRKKEIELIKDRHKLNVNTDLIIGCVNKIWGIVAFGEANNKFDIDIPIESLEEMVEWLGCQNIRDTYILMMRMDMIYNDLDVMDKALDTLYRVLADVLLEEE